MFGPLPGDLNNRGFVYGDDPQMVRDPRPDCVVYANPNCLFSFFLLLLQGPISIAPVVPPEPNAGSDLAPYRYGGPQKRRAKRISRAAVTEKKGIKLVSPTTRLIWQAWCFYYSLSVPENHRRSDRGDVSCIRLPEDR